MDNKQFRGKIAFVTGATSGIGRACAVGFAKGGASVACVGRNRAALQAIADEIKTEGSRALMVEADISDDSQTESALNSALETFGGIDILVNAAGHIGSGTIENTSMKSWDDMMNVNVRAIFHLMQKALPGLIERRGNIVNVSSVTGLKILSRCARILCIQSRVGSVNQMFCAGTGGKRSASQCSESRSSSN